MLYYTGLDISMKETAVCIVNEHGEIVREALVDTDPKAIALFLHKTKLSIAKVALESGCLSHWLIHELVSLKIPAICVDARHIAAILSTTINKTDKNDARGIANAVRCGMYREVYAKPLDSIEKGILLSARDVLVEQRVQATNTVRGLLKSYGKRISEKSTTKQFYIDVREAISGLSEIARISIEEVLATAEDLQKRINRFDKIIKKIANEEKYVKQLLTVPGVGPITAMYFVMTIGDPKRFVNSRSVGAYLGMTPSQYSSGETQRQGRISKCGSNELRKFLRESGHLILTRSVKWSKVKAWGMKIAAKHGIEKASMAVGRKLSVIMHRMMITGENFIYGNPPDSEPGKDKDGKNNSDKKKAKRSETKKEAA